LGDADGQMFKGLAPGVLLDVDISLPESRLSIVPSWEMGIQVLGCPGIVSPHSIPILERRMTRGFILGIDVEGLALIRRKTYRSSARLAQREILYRILRTPQAKRLRAISTSGDLGQRTARAISWLRANYAKPLHMEELASTARMGRALR
jgi:hypothetical protein